MIGNETNLSKLNNASTVGDCQVCIGCGRCGRIHQDMHVLVNFLPLSDSTPEKQPERVGGTGEKKYALAVDLGTTTIAMCLTDDRGRELGSYCQPNPQYPWGADVLSRIQAAQDPGQCRQMQQCVWHVLQEGFEVLQKQIPERNASVTIGLAGNTTMLYLLQGYVTGELGRAPFRVSHPEIVCAQLCGYPMYGFPPLSAFVGGDILAGIWSSGMWQSEKPVLLMDLGTNGEIALGNRDRILTCATAAGPAFEGGPCQGIWGADMVSLTGELLKRGLVDETGLLVDPYFEQGIQIGGVRITQGAIRALQLAKGAIRAGVELLLDAYGCKASEVEQVLLAGGMGYYMQPAGAAQIGLLPKELAEKAVAAGNTALGGAARAALAIGNQGLEPVVNQWKRIQQSVQTINLATHSDFEPLYLGFLDFPCLKLTKVD